ncbi:hypothetical protein [Stakelama tenebrarum]|uniref:Uncharacterized protein n=1 Tax=Stakelama tenebrarum TaxID=2711215 RepID=A0A6G6Y3C2_9SPHN|nr:hypothetical protein [Sphingosinithalassobacter tenebrarum]QIG79218.1 hypothetical protein G5C33_05035 [Sphingosinithalassobacter tenebrarum]
MARRRLSAIHAATMGAALVLGGCTYATGYSGYSAPAAGPWLQDIGYGGYAWIDRADALADAFGDAPPDFSFAFDGGYPWAWQTADGYWMVVEPAGGGLRSYFFEPGEWAPFLVRDFDYAFAYDRGRPVAVYDRYGRMLSPGEAEPLRSLAYADLARGRRIHDAMGGSGGGGWYKPGYTQWAEFSLFFYSTRAQWDSGWQRQPGWAQYRRTRTDRDRFEAERRRRRDASERWRHWREGGRQGPPPGRGDGHDRPGRDQRPDRPERPDRPDRPPRPTPAPAPAPTPRATPDPQAAEGPVGRRPVRDRPDRPEMAEDRPMTPRPGTQPPQREAPRPDRPPRTLPHRADERPVRQRPPRPERAEDRPSNPRPQPGRIDVPNPPPVQTDARPGQQRPTPPERVEDRSAAPPRAQPAPTPARPTRAQPAPRPAPRATPVPTPPRAAPAPTPSPSPGARPQRRPSQLRDARPTESESDDD